MFRCNSIILLLDAALLVTKLYIIAATPKSTRSSSRSATPASAPTTRSATPASAPTSSKKSPHSTKKDNRTGTHTCHFSPLIHLVDSTFVDLESDEANFGIEISGGDKESDGDDRSSNVSELIDDSYFEPDPKRPVFSSCAAS